MDTLCLAIAYVAYKNMAATETVDRDGDRTRGGWVFSASLIKGTEGFLGLGPELYGSHKNLLIDQWFRSGDRMKVRTVRTDFGALLGQPKTRNVDWNEIRA